MAEKERFSFEGWREKLDAFSSFAASPPFPVPALSASKISQPSVIYVRYMAQYTTRTRAHSCNVINIPTKDTLIIS